MWAINEGRQCARVADRYLEGLPPRDPRAGHVRGHLAARRLTALGADPPDKAQFGSGHGITD